MNRIVSFVFKELMYHKANAVLAIVGVAAGVAVCVGLSILNDASNRETSRIQRDIGFNLRIIPRETDMLKFYTLGYSEHTFAESAAKILAAQETLSYNHIVPTLGQRLELGDGVSAILTGIGDALYPTGQKRPAMVRAVKKGHVHLGFEVARLLHVKSGETIELKGEVFKVVRVAPEMGDINDIRVIGNLSDVQRVLGQVGRINEISAIDCLCLTSDAEPQAILRSEIEKVIPDAKVVMLASIADARARQRKMMATYAAVSMQMGVLVAGVWVAVLAMLNVKARTSEIGLLRALGYSGGRVAELFLGKAFVIGIVGGLIGYGVGVMVAFGVGPGMFELTAKSMKYEPILLVWSLLGASLGSCIASFIPAAIAIAQDPAKALSVD